jgi:alpha-L-fucosidase
MTQVLPTPGDTSWFVRDRFGLFIHWGLYALAARHEWVKSHEAMTDEQYEKYFRHFDPDLYDPAIWARAAAGAGMKYFVITTKHHEGFCLWDTAMTDYKAPAAPLCKRDLLSPMVKAFRDRGLRVGLYHSLIDWHHPQYVLDPYHGPHRHKGDLAERNRGRDQMKYADYLHAQVRELLEQYDPDILWLDYSYPRRDEAIRGKGHEDWRSEELVAMVRKLCPKILLDNRLDLDKQQCPEAWDFITPEQSEPRQWPTLGGRPVVWENCQTFSGAWGYYRDEASWKSVRQLISLLITTVSRGGNLLLNVGPTARGEFDGRAIDRLEGMGRWMRLHQRSIYGCTAAPAEFTCPENCRLTWNPDTKRMYVHVLDWPLRMVYLPGEAWVRRVRYAQFLADGSEITMRDASKPDEKGGAYSTWSKTADYGTWGRQALVLDTPVEPPAGVEVPVIELFLD